MLTFDKTTNDRFTKFSRTLQVDNTAKWAWANYKPLLTRIAREFQCRSLCEIGGGRSPLLTKEEAELLGVRYTVNDIARSELDRAPQWLDKACFDIAGANIPTDERERYDLVFSKMVMEHVRDGRKAYQNTFSLLRPGGIFLHFHPVLYSAPFVINWMLPESVTAPLLGLFRPNRHNEGIPKFPARYSYCAVTTRTLDMIKSTGFSHVALIPFFGHGYFHGLPGVKNVSNYLATYARQKKYYLVASYCYGLGKK